MTPSHFSPDIVEFMSLLSKHQVQYLIVGGEAVIYHGFARLTGDVDFFYALNEENAKRLYLALTDFWTGTPPGLDHGHAELLMPGLILQYGRPPNRIDLINQISGVSFEEAWNSRVDVAVSVHGGSIVIHFIGLESLIRNKEASGRDKDREDLKYLRSVKGENRT